MIPFVFNGATVTSGGFLSSQSLPQEQLEQCRSLYLQGKSEHKKENFVEAVRWFSKAVYLQEMMLGKYHQDTIKTYWRLGRAASLAKQEQQAVEAFHRAMRMAETTFETSVCHSLLNDVESVWSEVGQLEEGGTSNEAETRSPSIADSSSPSPLQDFEKLLALEKTGDQACKKKEFLCAIQSYQEALDLLTKVAGSSDTLCGADLRVKQSTCYLKVNNAVKASEALSAAHECYLRRLGDNHPATLGTAASLKTLHKRFFQQKKNSNNLDGKKGMWWSASVSSLGSEASGIDRQDAPVPVN